ncbi:hypothetical protein D3C75_940130 [compost metagenome]
MPDLLQLAGPVKCCRFIQMGINAPHRRQIDDCAKPGLLPDPGAEEDSQPRAGLVQEANGLPAHFDDQSIDGPGLCTE